MSLFPFHLNLYVLSAIVVLRSRTKGRAWAGRQLGLS